MCCLRGLALCWNQLLKTCRIPDRSIPTRKVFRQGRRNIFHRSHSCLICVIVASKVSEDLRADYCAIEGGLCIGMRSQDETVVYRSEAVMNLSGSPSIRRQPAVQ
jgi:hypothetical protein